MISIPIAGWHKNQVKSTINIWIDYWNKQKRIEDLYKQNPSLVKFL